MTGAKLRGKASRPGRRFAVAQLPAFIDNSRPTPESAGRKLFIHAATIATLLASSVSLGWRAAATAPPPPSAGSFPPAPPPPSAGGGGGGRGPGGWGRAAAPGPPTRGGGGEGGARSLSRPDNAHAK